MPLLVGNANVESCLLYLNIYYRECAPAWTPPSEHKQNSDTQWLACAISACESAYANIYRQECIEYMHTAKTNLEVQAAVDVFKSAQNTACYGYDELTFSYYPSIRIAGGFRHISFAQCSINIGICLQNCEPFLNCRDSYNMCLDQTCMGVGEYSMECYSQAHTNTMVLDSHGYYIAEAARSFYGCPGDGGGGGGGGGGSSSGTTCNGNPCGENIISCCPYQGSEVCANPDGTCPQEGNQCGTGYCTIGETCCSANVCSVAGACPDSGGGGGGGGGGSCNNNGICESWENADYCSSDCGCNNNNICESGRGETPYTCGMDCGCNSNSYCEAERGEAYGNCEDCSSNSGGEPPNGGFNPCPGGWMGPNGCEYPGQGSNCVSPLSWSGTDCVCNSPYMDFGGTCREPTNEDCLSPRGSYWDGTQCVCPSQYIDGGMGECVPVDNGGGQYLDPSYGRRLRGGPL